MNAARPITEDELHAFVDGLLTAERHGEVAAYLAAHPEAAARVDGYAARRQQLREALGPIADEPIPARLNPRNLAAGRRRTAPPWLPAAGWAAALAIGVVGGWGLRGTTIPPSQGVGALAREAASSYRVHAADPRRPVELAATQRVELIGWVSDRVGAPIEAPDLAAAGYGFVGGRVVTTPHGPAAFFLYQDVEGRRLAVLARPMAAEKNTRMSEHDDRDVGGVTWADDGIGYSLVGRASAAELHPLADQVRRQIDERT